MKNQFQGAGGGGSVLKNQFEGGGGGGGSELSDQLLDLDVPTLASQDKLKVSPKGLPFVIMKILYNTPQVMLKSDLGIYPNSSSLCRTDLEAPSRSA